jgi:hypothetical protein
LSDPREPHIIKAPVTLSGLTAEDAVDRVILLAVRIGVPPATTSEQATDGRDARRIGDSFLNEKEKKKIIEPPLDDVSRKSSAGVITRKRP